MSARLGEAALLRSGIDPEVVRAAAHTAGAGPVATPTPRLEKLLGDSARVTGEIRAEECGSPLPGGAG